MGSVGGCWKDEYSPFFFSPQNKRKIPLKHEENLELQEEKEGQNKMRESGTKKMRSCEEHGIEDEL
jgi:hypothetical protein